MTKKPNDSRRSGKQGSRQDEARWQRPNSGAPSSGDRFPSVSPESPPAQTRRRRPATEAKADASDRTRNLISLFFLLATFGALGYFVLIWQNPYTPLNPLSPPTPLPLLVTATFTPAPPTATTMPTEAPTPTDTPSQVPTFEATMTFTPAPLEGATVPPSTLLAPGDSANYRFALQNNRVIYLTNPDARGACNWSSIAGSVMNFDGSALNGYGIHVVGEGFDMTVATGSAPGFGPGGFEVPLGSVARDAQYAAQLVDPQGVAVSPVYTVDTNSDCELNITALRFVETESLD